MIFFAVLCCTEVTPYAVMRYSLVFRTKKEVEENPLSPSPPPPLSPCDKWAHTPSPRREGGCGGGQERKCG